MRILTVTGIFEMVGPDEYAHTPFSLAYIEGHEVDFLKLWFVSAVPLFVNLLTNKQLRRNPRKHISSTRVFPRRRRARRYQHDREYILLGKRQTRFQLLRDYISRPPPN